MLGSIEHCDDRTGKASEKRECGNNRKVNVFGHNYARGIFRYGVKMAFGDQPQYGFVIGAAHVAGRNGDKEIVSLEAHCRGDYLNFKEPFVLADNVESMEGVKGVIPSFIRFQVFNDIALNGGEGLYEFTPLIPVGSKGLGINGDWKINVVNIRYAIASGERASENIQAAPNDIDVSSGFDKERQRQWLFFCRYYDIVRRIRWKLFNTHVDVVIEPDIQALFEGWELGYGPIDCGLSG